MKRLVSAFAALSLLAMPAVAAPAKKKAPAKKAAPAQPPLDPDLKAAAEEVVKLTGVEATNDASLTEQANELRTGSLVQQEVDRSPEMKAARLKSPAQWAPVMKRFGERQADILDEVKVPAEAEFHDRLVRAYATRFTLDELKAVTEFYQSPAGQKLVTTIPPIMAETMGNLQDSIGERMAPRVKALRADFIEAVKPLLAGAPAASSSTKTDDGR